MVTRTRLDRIVSVVATFGGIALLVVGAAVTAETVNALSLDASAVGLPRAAAGLAAAVAGCLLLLVARRDTAPPADDEERSDATASHIWEW